MAFLGLDMNRNLSLYSLPLAWLISAAPRVYSVTLGNFDNKQPRAYLTTAVQDPRLDAATKAKIARAEGAQLNGFENLGFFAAAVLAGNVARLRSRTLNSLCLAYLGSRVVYTWLYVHQTTVAMANARSAVFFGGIGLIFTLFIKSANKLRDRI